MNDRFFQFCGLIVGAAFIFMMMASGVSILHQEFSSKTYRCHAGKDGIVHLPADCVRL